MTAGHRLTVLTLSLVAAGALCAGAQAAIVTVGSPLTASFVPSSCSTASCTTFNTSFADSTAKVASPVTGTVIRWRILFGQPPFRYTLRVGERNGLLFTGAGSSAPTTPAGPGVETFPTKLPIQAGQLVGIDLEASAPIGFITSTSSTYAFFQPPLANGETRSAIALTNGEVAFNADVQPLPTIGTIAPSSGSFKGGTKVIVTGTDFTGATSVAFGSVPAASFTVDSDTQITAVAPPVSKPGPLPLTVTTLAGSATATTPYEAEACEVPKLKGKKLKGAKKQLRKRDCKIGKVKKVDGATAKTGKVSRQKPKPGTLLPPGAKVKVTLAP